MNGPAKIAGSLTSKARHFDTGTSVLVPTRDRFRPNERTQIARILRLGKGNKYSTIRDIEGRVFVICSLKYDPERPEASKERDAIRGVYQAAVAFQEKCDTAKTVLWRFIHLYPDLDDLRSNVDALLPKIKAAANAPVPRGRPPDERFEYLVKWLAELFDAHRGKHAAVTFNESAGKYQGEFFTLVSICVEPWKFMSNVALGKSIQRLLKLWTKS